MNYYISDLHLFCNSQTCAGEVNYDNRPFKDLDEMHSVILKRWNGKITNGDTVYILGDIALRGKRDALIGLVAQLKGKKVLLKGNHDDLSDLRYKQLFTEICDYKEINDYVDGQTYKLVLCHYPILLWNGQHKGVIHLYGHTHTSIEEAFYRKCLNEINQSEELSLRRHGGTTARAYNVGCMHDYMGFEPRALKDILSSAPEHKPLEWEKFTEGACDDDDFEWSWYRCPTCKRTAREHPTTGKPDYSKFCPHCGERLLIPDNA